MRLGTQDLGTGTRTLVFVDKGGGKIDPRIASFGFGQLPQGFDGLPGLRLGERYVVRQLDFRAPVHREPLGIADSLLDTVSANTAAGIRDRIGVSVADSHIGAVIQSASTGEITVVTSDPGDMRRVAGDKNIIVAAI